MLKRTSLLFVLLFATELVAQSTLTVLPPEVHILNDEQSKRLYIGLVDGPDMNKKAEVYRKLYEELIPQITSSFFQNAATNINLIDDYETLDGTAETMAKVRSMDDVMTSEIDRRYGRRLNGPGLVNFSKADKEDRASNEAFMAKYGPAVGEALNTRYLLKFRAAGFFQYRRKKMPENLRGGFAYEVIIVDTESGQTIFYDLDWHGKKQLSQAEFNAPPKDSDILNFNNAKEIKPNKMAEKIEKLLSRALSKWEKTSEER